MSTDPTLFRIRIVHRTGKLLGDWCLRWKDGQFFFSTYQAGEGRSESITGTDPQVGVDLMAQAINDKLATFTKAYQEAMASLTEAAKQGKVHRPGFRGDHNQKLMTQYTNLHEKLVVRFKNEAMGYYATLPNHGWPMPRITLFP